MYSPRSAFGPDQPCEERQCEPYANLEQQLQLTFGVRIISAGQRGLQIGCPFLAAFWIFLISDMAHCRLAVISLSMLSRFSTILT